MFPKSPRNVFQHPAYMATKGKCKDLLYNNSFNNPIYTHTHIKNIIFHNNQTLLEKITIFLTDFLKILVLK